MTKGMEPVPVRDDEPVQIIPQGYTVQVPVAYEPEWRAVVPPVRPDHEIERYWSLTMAPVRWLVRHGSDLFLWCTWTWYRAAITVATVIFIWSLASKN